MSPRARPLIVSLLVGAALAATGCAASSDPSAPKGKIAAVGAENEYANVISQIGGRYVQVTAIESNPNIDPHAFEASPSVANVVSSARVIVQNGLGYDTYMNKIESASPRSSRKVIDVQHLLGLPDSTRNPHVWYMPRTMPTVAKALAAEFSATQPQHGAYFRANLARFDQSLIPWYQAIKRFRASYPHTPVAATEPVFDYLLQAAGADNRTPFTLELNVMNGIDPAPQNVTLQNDLLSQQRVEVLVYNQQVTDSLTKGFLKQAASHGIPVIGVYETMPTPGYDYQSWMLAELDALRKAVADKTSTAKL